ncbi:hypothetical protein [Mycoplasma bradburyae]|uniref:hypothetical protein n=1 Tax=Mycoplasma bradburyae TaxID=2963128 RepID=UPI00234246DF|nr:hypothetical protein [Mycoplasma bradburyae]MDC4183928.1 hypothetical protein [Mycoplasma bradburyae]
MKRKNILKFVNMLSGGVFIGLVVTNYSKPELTYIKENNQNLPLNKDTNSLVGISDKIKIHKSFNRLSDNDSKVIKVNHNSLGITINDEESELEFAKLKEILDSLTKERDREIELLSNGNFVI